MHGAKVVNNYLAIENEKLKFLDDARAGPVAQFPGAQPDRRDFCAIGFDKMHTGTLLHRAPL